MALPPPVRALGGGRIRWERGRADSRAATGSVNLAKLGLSVYICEMGTTYANIEGVVVIKYDGEMKTP